MPIKIWSGDKPQAPALNGQYWLALAQEYASAQKLTDAAHALQQAEAMLPLEPQIYVLQAALLKASGRHAEALAAGMVAEALEQDSAPGLCNIGIAYAKKNRFKQAEKWYRLALMLDGELGVAHQNLAAILRQNGLWAEAGDHYERSYRRQALFIDEAEVAPARRHILIFCSARPGSVPFDYLIPTSVNTRIKWVIELAPEQALPHYDVVFNAISDADVALYSRVEVERFLASNHKPWLNRPERVILTGRDHAAALLDGIQGIQIPAVARWQRGQDGAAMDAHALIADKRLSYPVIVRPVGGHGGEGVTLLQSPQEVLPATTADAVYLINYNEYRSNDGYFRKYRVIFVDRIPYPYHLAIGSHWLAHYDTADMLNPAWKIRDEARFLSDPIGVLGQAGWAALGAIAKRIDLDYCGIDFSLLPNGELLIFEANATMLVHPEDIDGPLNFKNPYVQTILDAFERLLAERMANGASV